MSLEQDSITLTRRLADMEARIQAKNDFSNSYRETVMSALTKIGDKMRKLLGKQKNALDEMEKKSKQKMGDLSKKLLNLRDEEKKKGETAISGVKEEQAELSGKLEGANKEVEKLQEQLKVPDPNLQVLQQSVDLITKQLADAQKAQGDAESALQEAQEVLVSKNRMIDEAAKAIADGIKLVETLMDKIDKMHITADDLDEALKKLQELENMMEGDDEGDIGTGDLFSNAEANAAAADEKNAMGDGTWSDAEGDDEDKGSDSFGKMAEPEPKDDSDIKSISDDELLLKAEPKDAIIEEGSIQAGPLGEKQDLLVEDLDVVNPDKIASEQGKKQAAKKGQNQLDDIMRMGTTGKQGGKTRRRRRRRTIKKGGYIMKKSKGTRKHRKKKGKTSASSFNDRKTNKSTRKTTTK